MTSGPFKEASPAGYIRAFSDADLRADLEAGLKVGSIALKYSVSRQAVYKRIHQLGVTTTAAVVAPVESERFVNQSLDAMSELLELISNMKRLQSAYDAWLRDAKDPGKYDIGPRSDEILVTYWGINEEGKSVKEKGSLQSLLHEIDTQKYATINASFRGADPRVEFRKAIAELRQTVMAAVELARLLADAEAMMRFRDALLTEIAKVSPEVAETIALSVRRSLVLQSAFDRHESLPAR